MRSVCLLGGDKPLIYEIFRSEITAVVVRDLMSVPGQAELAEHNSLYYPGSSNKDP